MLLSLALLVAPAGAESPGVLPKGSEVVYSGAGFTTFGSLKQRDAAGRSEVVQRDRELRPRVDLYGSLGLTDGLQLSASVPVVGSVVSDDPALQPCPQLLQSEGYCDSYLTVGEARIDARYGLLRRRTKVTAGLAAQVDSWNAGRRGQYNSAGSGRTQLEAFVVTGGEVQAGDWRLRGLILGGYAYALAPSVTPTGGGAPVKAPGDSVRASVEGRANAPGPLAFEVGVHAQQRLTGVALDSAWVDDWFRSSLDRWNVLQYSAVAVSGKVSVDLPNSMGLHAGLTRTVAVENGPADLTDVSVGWHRYFAP